MEEGKNNKTKPNTGSGDKADVTDLAVYASGRARVEHITQQVSSDYQVEANQGECVIEQAHRPPVIPGVARSESRLSQPVTTSSLQNDNSMRLCKLQLTTTAHHTMGPKRCMAGSTVQVCTRSSGKLSFQSPPYSNGKVRINMQSTN